MLCVTSPFEKPIPRNRQESLWRGFMERGSSHSNQATLLPFLIRKCEQEKIPYMLKAYPRRGYYIERLKDEGR